MSAGAPGARRANEAFAHSGRGEPAIAASALAAIDNTLCLPFLSPGYNNFTNHQSESEKEFSGTAKIDLPLQRPRSSTYASSFARGYKAGGFNLDRVRMHDRRTAGCAAGSAAAITPDPRHRLPR